MRAAALEPAKTALVVIDTQNDFCHPQGVNGRAGSDMSRVEAMMAAIRRLVTRARAAGVTIVWVRSCYDPIYLGPAFVEQLDKAGLGGGICRSGTTGSEWYGDLQPDLGRGEIELTKHRNSAFWDTAIDLALRTAGVETVLLTGISSCGCVDSTGRDAFFRNYRVVLVQDASTSYSLARHEATLERYRYFFGSVLDTQSILDAWDLPSRRTELSAATAKRALLICGMQQDLAGPGSLAARCGFDCADADAVAGRIRELATNYRAAGDLVVHGHFEAADWATPPAWKHQLTAAFGGTIPCRPGTPGADGTPGIDTASEDVVITFRRWSPFAETGLDLLLRSNGITEVAFVGALPGRFGRATAIDAANLDIAASVVADAVTTLEPGSGRSLHDPLVTIRLAHELTL